MTTAVGERAAPRRTVVDKGRYLTVCRTPPLASGLVTLVPMTVSIAAPVPAVRPAPLDRLPGSADDDPFLRLAAAWLVGYPVNTAKAYRRDLESWAAWCERVGVHPLAAE